MHILIAPNSFKNSLTAPEAAKAIQDGLSESRLDCSSTLFPIGDGGDGTADLLLKNLKGARVWQTVHDPFRRAIPSSFGWADEAAPATAVIEMANASGLKLLQKKEYDPLHATSYGTGELILAALEKGAKKIILCIGGSATVDGGTGILEALGVRFFTKSGYTVHPEPESLADLQDIDITEMDSRIKQTELVVLCDVKNPLLGPQGSAAVFGPQKGASSKDIQLLDEGLARFAELVKARTGHAIQSVPHGGAAGGVAAGLYGVLGARLVNGIDYYLDQAGFDEELEKADLLITGEGSLDEQTLEGKGPLGVAYRAKQKSIPVIGLAGQLRTAPGLDEYFDVLLSINRAPIDLDKAISETHENLVHTARVVGELLRMHTLAFSAETASTS